MIDYLKEEALREFPLFARYLSLIQFQHGEDGRDYRGDYWDGRDGQDVCQKD